MVSNAPGHTAWGVVYKEQNYDLALWMLSLRFPHSRYHGHFERDPRFVFRWWLVRQR